MKRRALHFIFLAQARLVLPASFGMGDLGELRMLDRWHRDYVASVHRPAWAFKASAPLHVLLWITGKRILTALKTHLSCRLVVTTCDPSHA